MLQKAFAFLDHSDAELVSAALRAIGNAIAEHEKNVTKIEELGFVGKALDLIQNSNHGISRNASAVLANLIQGNEEVQEELLSRHAMKILIDRLSVPSDAYTLKLVSFAILSLIETPKGVSEFLDLKGLEKIIELAHSTDDKTREFALSALETLSEDGEPLHCPIFLSERLFHLIHPRSPISPELIDNMKRPLYVHKCVDFLLSIVNSKAPAEIKHKAAKCLPHILTNGTSFALIFCPHHGPP